MNFIIHDKDGKPQFIGKEDPNNTPIQFNKPCVHGGDKCSHMQCPIGGEWVDYLVGDDIGDGKRGCEAHWKPPTQPIQRTDETTDKIEII